MKRIYFILLFVGGSMTASLAQDGYTALHYDISLGISSTADFISAPSFRGVGFDYRKMVTSNVGVGFSVGWSTFYQRIDRASYALPDGTATLSGVQFRYLNAIPLHVNTNYYFGVDGELRPYVGLGVGTLYSERRTEMGQWSTSTASWEFSLQPEVGVLYPVNPDANVFFAAKFTTPFQNSTFPSQPFVSFNIGLAWMIH
jgi:opacity protein-like surface antigen